jgi:hypothetical protein
MAQKAPPEYSEGNTGPTWRLDGADKLHSRCSQLSPLPNIAHPDSLKLDPDPKPDFFFVPGSGPSDDKKYRNLTKVPNDFTNNVIMVSTFFHCIFAKFLSSVADPGCLSRIPDYFYPSRIPDPTRLPKRGGEIFCCPTIFCSHKYN